MLLYIYAIESTNIPKLKYYNFEGQRYLTLFSCNEDGKLVILVMKFEPFILLRLKDQPDTTLPNISKLQKLASAMDAMLLKDRGGLRVVLNVQTPVMGFTNSEKHANFKLYYRDIYMKKKILTHLRKIGLGENTEYAEPVHIYHQDEFENNLAEGEERGAKQCFGVKEEELFRHETDLRSHTWAELDMGESVHIHPDPKSVAFNAHMVIEKVDPKWLKMDATNLRIPPLTVVHLAGWAISSTGTVVNPYEAQAKIPEDYISHLRLAIHRLDRKPIFMSMEAKKPVNKESENQLISQFQETIRSCSAAILVQSSCRMNIIQYIATRYPMALSLLCDLSSKPKEYKNKIFDVPHTGRDRMDLVPVLGKFQISPPFDRCSLDDVYEHEKCLHKKKHEDLELDVSSVRYQFNSPEEVIQTRLKREVNVMWCCVNDNSFFISHASLSNACDVSFTQLCEKGVELMTRNTFMRAFYKRKLYYNHENQFRDFVTIKLPRQQSSFPHPPIIPRLQASNILHPSSSDTTKPLFNLTVQQVKKKTKKRYQGGYVPPPRPGFNLDPHLATTIFDFAAMYPSIMVAMLTCYMRVLYDEKWLKDPLCEFQQVPISDDECIIFVYKYDGKIVETIIPEIMQEIMTSRAKIKLQMKKETDPVVKNTLDCRQITEKVRNNGAYGFLGSQTSGMQCRAIAAMICMLGEWQNRIVMLYLQNPQRYWVLPTFDYCVDLLRAKETQREEETKDIKQSMFFMQLCLDFTPLPQTVFNIVRDYIVTPISFMCPAQLITVFLVNHPECEFKRKIGTDLVGDIVYGDTDSCFGQWMIDSDIKTEKEILDTIVAIARKFQKFIPTLFPAPTNVEFEALKWPLLMGKGKKLHCSLVYMEGDLSKPPKSSIKGAAFLKRDRCLVVRSLCGDIMERILHRAPAHEIVQHCSKVLHTTFHVNFISELKALEPFMISIEFTGEYAKEEDAMGHVLSKIIEEETGSRPKIGDRMKYVVAHFEDKRLHNKCVVTPSYFIHHKKHLDFRWYLQTNFLRAVQQITQHDLLLFTSLQRLVNDMIVTLEVSYSPIKRVSLDAVFSKRKMEMERQEAIKKLCVEQDGLFNMEDSESD